MKDLFLLLTLNAVILFLISCASVKADREKGGAEMLQCSVLRELLFDSARDQILLSACLNEAKVNCTDLPCFNREVPLCFEHQLIEKAKYFAQYRKQECWFDQEKVDSAQSESL